MKVKSTKHFSESELQCKCGNCAFEGMDENFMELLEAVRTDPDWNKLMKVSSAYRCPEHNSAVSSTGMTGPHTSGKAIDIQVSGAEAHLLLGVAMGYDFSGIGIAQKGAHGSRFIHLDTLETGETKGPRPWIWSY
jgi:uncharacterized protein YcbK (DUF882 family)